jgi:hypothetical protein
MKRHLSFVAALGMCLFGLNATVDAQQIKADTGGIAIGGSVTGSTINIGVPPPPNNWLHSSDRLPTFRKRRRR